MAAPSWLFAVQFHHLLLSFLSKRGVIAIQGCDAASKDTLNGALIKKLQSILESMPYHLSLWRKKDPCLEL